MTAEPNEGAIMKTNLARLLTFALLLVVIAGMAPFVRSAAAQTSAGPEIEIGPDGVTPYARVSSGRNWGTATLVSVSPTKAYWITAAHVATSSKAKIHRKSDHTLDGVVVKRGTPDLALVRTSRLTVWEKPLPLWVSSEMSGRTYWSEGYSASQGLGRRKGGFAYHFRNGGARWNFPSLPGDSGSSIWTVHEDRKFLAGITARSDYSKDMRGRVYEGSNTTGASAGDIRKFMTESGFKIDEYGFAKVPSVGAQQSETKPVAGGRIHPDPLLSRQIGIFGGNKLFARPKRPDS